MIKGVSDPEKLWITSPFIRLYWSHVPRTGKLQARGGSMQGLRRKYPGARGDDAVAADRGRVSALP